MLIGKDNGKAQMPKVANMPPVPPPPQKANPNHPAVAQHIQHWNEMADELDRLRADNLRLYNEIDVERRVNSELQHSVDVERAEKEKFQRYCVEMRTHAIDVHQKTAAMLEAARDAAVNEPPKQIQPPEIDVLEAGVAEIARKFAPQQDVQ
jgi:hypothetical protein